MRLISQLAIIAVLGAAGGGGYYYWQHAQKNPANAPAAQRPAAPPMPVEVAPVRTGVVVEKAEAVGTTRANESVIITAKQTEFALGGATAQLRIIGRDLADTPA